MMRSSPPGLAVRVDAERQLADRLVGEQVVSGMDASEAGVAKELFHAAGPEDSAPPLRSIAVSTTCQACFTTVCLVAMILSAHPAPWSAKLDQSDAVRSR
jgi:hypothetical protein